MHNFVIFIHQIVDLKAELIRKESQLKREKFGEEQKVNRQPKVFLVKYNRKTS